MVENQRQLLEFIRAFTKRNGYPPTVEEMRVGLGWSSKSVVEFRLMRLEMMGAITRTRKAARTVRVVDAQV